MTRLQAFQASENKIIVHYGDGIRTMFAVNNILAKSGRPYEIHSGGKPNQVELFVGKKPTGKYTEDDVLGGVVIGNAIDAFDERLGQGNTQ